MGRAVELAELETAIKAHRLVTLTGVGGVGKTRLASETAARLSSDFSDGVWLVELAPIGDPAAVPEAVAAALGIIQQPGLSLADSVAAAMEGRARLLIFDNCEHVLDAAADLVDAILAHSSTVKVLATSREGLRLPDEQLWPVPSLDTRSETDSAAATLFVDRANAVAPGFSAMDDGDAVVEICRRLDGIPLAIELAASRMLSMTVTEVRDRLDDRFRLLVGSRRGLGRHQTLRHAVQWSYELLDDVEKLLLTRCSVFAGGFDLPGACAVADRYDEFSTLDTLDALVRKSLLVADRSAQRTRYSMLETIRQFAEEQLVVSGQADSARTAHAKYYAGQEANLLDLWDSPRQREAHDWFTVELANLRTAFRWAADRDDLDAAAAIANYASFLGYWVEQYEPSSWAEELIEPARVVEHKRLAQLYTMAAHCYLADRMDDFVRYAEAGQRAIESGRFDEVSVVAQAILGGGYLNAFPPERGLEWSRGVIAQSARALSYGNLVFALTFAGAYDEAMEISEQMLAAADTASNPHIICAATLSYGHTHRKADPAAAYNALRQGLMTAQASGNRQMESILAVYLSHFAATHADPTDAFELLTRAIRMYHDSGSLPFFSGAAVALTVLFDRLGYYEAAATISGFADRAVARASFPEIDLAVTHLREILGSDAYDAFANAGTKMTIAAKAAYTLDHIDRARAALGSDTQ